MECELIEYLPLAFIRGVSIDNSLIVIDEAQNINVDNIINSADITLKKIKQYQILGFKNNLYPDYANENVSDKIVSIIQSYTHYINKKVWFKF